MMEVDRTDDKDEDSRNDSFSVIAEYRMTITNVKTDDIREETE
jgi:hypothetical protein